MTWSKMKAFSGKVSVSTSLGIVSAMLISDRPTRSKTAVHDCILAFNLDSISCVCRVRFLRGIGLANRHSICTVG